MAMYDESFLTQAEASLSALLEKLYLNETLYHTAMVDTPAKIDAFLEDYAYLSSALLQAYQTTLNQDYLNLAHDLTQKALTKFYEGGKWYFSKGEFITDAAISDSSYPGSIGVMVDVLLSLGVLVDLKYRDFAFSTLEFYSMKLNKKPIHSPYLFSQTLRYLKEDRIVKGNKINLRNYQESFSYTRNPYLLRHIVQTEETLLCGVQSCFTSLNNNSNFTQELEKTL